MTIAELFVNLGIKGDGDLRKGLISTNRALGDVKTMSLEAKAGILAMMYGMQQLMAQSGRTGSSLSLFEATTGLSADALQRHQHAARQFNVENEETEQSIRGLQKTMLDFALRKQPPKDFGLLAPYLDNFDTKRMTDPYYMVQQLQGALKKVPPQLRGVLKSAFEGLGITEGFYGALAKGAFTEQAMSKANVYTKGESERLRQVHAGWLNIGDAIAKGIGHLNAKYGPQLIKDIDKLVPKLMALTESFIRLSEALGTLKAIGMVFEGWGEIFKLIKSVIDSFTEGRKEGEKIIEKEGRWGLFKKNMESSFPIAAIKGAYQGTKSVVKEAQKPSDETRLLDAAMRGVARTGVKLPERKTNIEVNQNLNFQHDGKDHKKTGSSVKKAVQESYRQMSAQAQGS